MRGRHMHWISGNSFPETGMPSLFCHCMVLWHLCQKQVEPSCLAGGGAGRSYYSGEMITSCKVHCPTFGAEPACTSFLVVRLSCSVQWMQLENIVDCGFSVSLPGKRGRNMVLGQQSRGGDVSQIFEWLCYHNCYRPLFQGPK